MSRGPSRPGSAVCCMREMLCSFVENTELLSDYCQKILFRNLQICNEKIIQLLICHNFAKNMILIIFTSVDVCGFSSECSHENYWKLSRIVVAVPGVQSLPRI